VKKKNNTSIPSSPYFYDHAGENHVFSKQEIFRGILIEGTTLLIYSLFSYSTLFLKSYSEVDSFEEPSLLMPQTETVTSYYDALLKAPLIISQTAIIGIVFSHIFFQRVILNHFQLTRNGDTTNTDILNDTSYIRPVKRLFIILLSCGIAILVSATSLLLLQAVSLSSEFGMDIATTFNILSSTPVGPVWNIRVITSLIIIASSMLYYILEKRSLVKRYQTGLEGNNSSYSPPHKKAGKKGGGIVVLSNGLLYIITLAGAVSIFSNSMISHNTALSFLPSLAITMDWIHFMAVSIWLGGLFYISSILLMTIRLSISKKGDIDRSINRSLNVNTVHHTLTFLHYYFHIFLLSLPCLLE
jgi:copper transport protein